MKGEPPARTLAAEARLVASSCEASTSEAHADRVKEMRAEVDRAFKEWRDAQPDCWAQMRAEHARRKRLARPGSMWGSAIGESFGVGGLGLSGVGAGGGGRGEGIGLGAIGTLGSSARAGGPAASGSSARRATNASGTNNQVEGVDEADIVKTDGRYVYLASAGALRILEAMRPRLVSVTPLRGTVREMFVEGDRAVVYTSHGAVTPRCTYAYDCQFGGDGSRTRIDVLDVSDRAAPRRVRDFELSGSLVAARRIGGAVHTVVADGASASPPYETWPDDMPMCGTPEKVVRAKFAKLKAENERRIRGTAAAFPTLTEGGKVERLCAGLYQTRLRDGEAFTTVVSFDMRANAAPARSTTLQSRPGAVFASAEALYVAVVHDKKNARERWYSYYPSSVDEVSTIHKFSIGESPGATRYVGSGTVPGHVLNQFSMDEWYGYLRVATTRGRVPDPRVESAVSVLSETGDGVLARVGAVEKLAPGEDIRAVRFDGDRGYVVTFKKTDPLFVIDLYDPARPAVLGELKIPGFSTYMHRIDPDHLLSIGFDANDHGSFAYFDGVILQLFDVKDPTRPTLLHKEKIGTRGSSSQAATDHLAFNYFANEGLLAIPMTLCEGGADGRNGDRLAFGGLLVYDVDVDRGFTRMGGVDHGTEGATCSTWWSRATSAVKRSVFLDDLVYSIADDRVKVQSMKRFGVDLADISLLPEAPSKMAGALPTAR
jgi:uncharacterized secreted protein with C-terminal beta-propeller domain